MERWRIAYLFTLLADHDERYVDVVQGFRNWEAQHTKKLMMNLRFTLITSGAAD